jgi:hypothetical protein
VAEMMIKRDKSVPPSHWLGRIKSRENIAIWPPKEEARGAFFERWRSRAKCLIMTSDGHFVVVGFVLPSPSR